MDFHFFWSWKSWKINVEKEGHPGEGKWRAEARKAEAGWDSWRGATIEPIPTSEGVWGAL